MSLKVTKHLRYAALISHQNRLESTITNLSQENIMFKPRLTNWSKIIREAEKIVGYPTSFMNLRWLLSDEFANMAMHLRKIVGSNHPIVHTAKTLLYNEHNSLQPWGLIILLLSKAIKPPHHFFQINSASENQRLLAEIIEMIRTGHYVHRGLLNIPIEQRDKDTNTAMFGNKIAILIGDYLLVTANGMLARMRNQDMSYLISTALRDLSAGEFFGERDKQNMPLPGKPVPKATDEFRIFMDTSPLEVEATTGLPIREWTVRTMFNGASLLGRGCQGAVLLREFDVELQRNAYLFGCHLCLAWQAANEIQKFSDENKEIYSLVSAPVLFAINSNPELYSVIENVRDNITDVDLEAFKKNILKTDAIERTKSLYIDNVNKAFNYIETFGDNESISTIKKLIKTL